MYKGDLVLMVEQEIYGDKFALLCEIVINYKDGTSTIVNSDETWKCKKAKLNLVVFMMEKYKMMAKFMIATFR